MQVKLWRHFDLILLVVIIILIALGVMMIYSASFSTPDAQESFSNTLFGRQLIYAGLGLILMVIAASIDYRIYGYVTPLLYGLMIALLAAVLLLGESTHGARRWIDLAIFSMQPSEIAKLIFVVVLAKFLSDHREELKRFPFLLLSLLMAALPAGLVYFQPDLGTAIMFFAIWLGMVIIIGVPWKRLGALAVGGLLAVPFVYLVVLQEYMRQRLIAFINPASDPLGAGYNILQAEISVGSGGLLGKGFLHGTQSQLHFLRIQKTDFIFSVLGEELGFIGALLLLGLFILLLFRGVRAANLARDEFGKLIATGVVVMILVQVFINMGANLRLLPVTGVPLPLISYGGSSLITVLIALGTLQGVLIRQRKIEF